MAVKVSRGTGNGRGIIKGRGIGLGNETLKEWNLDEKVCMKPLPPASTEIV